MAEEQSGEKSELPTEHRRQEARKQGRFARSEDLKTAGHLFALALCLWTLGLSSTQSMVEFLKSRLEQPAMLSLDRGAVVDEFRVVLEYCAANILPVMLIVMAASIAIGMLQTGFLWLPEMLKIDWSHLDPINGLKRMFSVQAWIRFATSLAKVTALAAIASWFIAGEITAFSPATNAEPGILFLQLNRSVASLAMLLAVVMVALALAEYGWQKWHFERDLMMTRQELIDEMKQQDGDPKYRHLRREAYQKMLKSREIAGVREADVVIINPIEIAIALKYDPETMPAPTVIAKGKGELAARIRAIAAEHRIPIIERRPLAQALYKLVKVGQPIPAEMYDVFVEIMKYVYELTGKVPPLPPPT